MDEQRTDDPDHPGRPGAAADRPSPGPSAPGRSGPDAAGPDRPPPGEPAGPGPEARPDGGSRAWWANAPMPPGRPGTLRPAQWEPEPEPDRPTPGAVRPETWQSMPPRPTVVNPLPGTGGAGPEPGSFARPRLVAAEQGPDPLQEWDGPASRAEDVGNGPGYRGTERIGPEPTEGFGAAPDDGHRGLDRPERNQFERNLFARDQGKSDQVERDQGGWKPAYRARAALPDRQ